MTIRLPVHHKTDYRPHSSDNAVSIPVTGDTIGPLMTSHDPSRAPRIAHAYTVQHLTCDQIGYLEGITGRQVNRLLARAGIRREQGTWVQTTCAACGNAVSRRRAQWRKTRQSFCSQTCYYAKRANAKYKRWTHGAQLARATVRAAGFPLLKSHVVHHWDSNNRNNALVNLAVFATQREHMKFHHHGQPDPIWDGRLHQPATP